MFYESDTPLMLLSGHASCPRSLRERFVVVSPQCPADPERGDGCGIWLRKGWFDSSSYNDKLQDAIHALISTVLKTLPVDSERIAVVGSSMGAYAALELMSRWPGKFHAAGLVSAHYEVNPLETLVEQLTQDQALPFWFVHAYNDRLCPFQPIEKLVELLREKSKVEVRLTSYEEKSIRNGHFAERVAYY